MTRRHILFTLAAAAALSAAIVIVSMAYSIRNQRAHAYKQSIESATTEAQTEIGYTLKEYDGELAVFRGNSATPFKKLGIPVSIMTEQDQNMLKAGIFIQTEKELKSLIEDYTP